MCVGRAGWGGDGCLHAWAGRHTGRWVFTGPSGSMQHEAGISWVSGFVSRFEPWCAQAAMNLSNEVDLEDPQIVRPGSHTRVPVLDAQACTAAMNLSDEVDLEDYVGRPDKISNAEIAAICQEAGMHAVRKNRYVILPKDFEKGYKANVKKSDTDFDFYQ